MVATIATPTQLEIAALCVPAIYLLGLWLGRWLRRRYQVPLGGFYRLLCVVAAFFIPMSILENRHIEWLASDQVDVLLRYLGSALTLLAVIFGLQLLRRFYWVCWFERRHHVEAPKFLQQLTSGVLFCIAVALVLNLRHGQHVDTFLAGSGILAVVVGFAMQETLANIISGIALQIGKPFSVGDWLIIDNHRAEVMEVNWRSTRLRTNDDIFFDVPNRTVVGSTVTNLSYPTKTHSNRMRFGFEYSAPPNVVREIIHRVATGVAGVLEFPPVKVYLKEFGESAIVYELKYSLNDESRFNDIEDAIRTNLWYAVRRAGLTIPFPIRTVHLHRPPAGDERAAARDEVRAFIARQPMLAELCDSEREALVARAPILHFGRGEMIIHQGREGCSMFVIVRGEVEVWVRSTDQDTRVATLGAGEAFGEMCLLTGEARTATVKARTDCQILEIERGQLQPLIQANGNLAAKLSELLARRKLETDGILAATVPVHVASERQREYAAGFLRKISALFEI
jgi:small-conductance mechanosensitive channel/CRP-like cAMP-binding protein